MKARLSVLTAATAVVVGISYLGWSAPTARSVGTYQSRSRGSAAVGGHRELQRVIGAYEDRVAAHPNAADFAFLGQLYLRRGRQTGDLQTYLQAEQAVTDALALDPTDPGNTQLLATVRY